MEERLDIDHHLEEHEFYLYLNENLDCHLRSLAFRQNRLGKEIEQYAVNKRLFALPFARSYLTRTLEMVTMY